jgi:hypothetical protein
MYQPDIGSKSYSSLLPSALTGISSFDPTTKGVPSGLNNGGGSGAKNPGGAIGAGRFVSTLPSALKPASGVPSGLKAKAPSELNWDGSGGTKPGGGINPAGGTNPGGAIGAGRFVLVLPSALNPARGVPSGLKAKAPSELNCDGSGGTTPGGGVSEYALVPTREKIIANAMILIDLIKRFYSEVG